MPNPLYPSNDDLSFDDRWALPVEQPQFGTQIDPNWQDTEARANLAAQGITPEAIPTHRLTPVDYNPFEGNLSTVRGASEEVRPARANARTIFKDVLTDTWPAHLVQSATTLPGDVLTGREPIRNSDNQITEKVVERAQDIAGLMSGGAFSRTAEGAVLGSGPIRVATAEARAPRFYSAVEHAIESNPQTRANGEQWLSTIQNARGVKPEELDWMGLREFLNENRGEPVTKQQVQEFVNNNRVELKEVQRQNITPQMEEQIKARFERENPRPDDSTPAYDKWYDRQRRFLRENLENIGLPRYKDYQLPGGENYRELLLTLPSGMQTYNKFVELLRGKYGEGGFNNLPLTKSERSHLDRLQEIAGDEGRPNYTSSHWSEPNVLAHVRMNDRTIDGRRSLHLEEIQSDWHQAGRDQGYKLKNHMEVVPVEGGFRVKRPDGQLLGRSFRQENGTYADIPYRTKDEAQRTVDLVREHVPSAAAQGVPDAPFKKTWHELALKRMLREAAERGYERLSWTPGEAQAARYDLSKHVDTVHYNPETHRLIAKRNNNDVINENSVPPDRLKEYIGKEMADRIMQQEPNVNGLRSLKGDDLRIGGEGMRGFYDQMIPRAIEKIGKEWGVRAQRGNITKPETKLSYAELQQRRNGEKPSPSKFQQPVHYIDIPPAMRDSINRKGMPLFAGGFVLSPVDYDPWAVDQSTTNR